MTPKLKELSHPRRFFSGWKGPCMAVVVSFAALAAAGVSPARETSISPLRGGLGEYSSFQPTGDIRRFVGETLLFDISFLWFDNAAEARVGLYERDGVLYSVLEAHTKGFVGFFTAYRKHIYKATFDLVDGDTRVRSKKFEREVIIADGVEQTMNYFDYTTRTNWWHKYIDEEKIESGERKIPEDVNFDDILAAFYNFRNGVYGPLVKGAKFTINTIPEKGHTTISIHIKNGDEEKAYREAVERKWAEELLLKVIIPKEIFKTENGELMFWSSKHFIPLETIVKDYILLGDLHAKFSRRILGRPDGRCPHCPFK